MLTTYSVSIKGIVLQDLISEVVLSSSASANANKDTSPFVLDPIRILCNHGNGKS